MPEQKCMTVRIRDSLLRVRYKKSFKSHLIFIILALYGCMLSFKNKRREVKTQALSFIFF